MYHILASLGSVFFFSLFCSSNGHNLENLLWVLYRSNDMISASTHTFFFIVVTRPSDKALLLTVATPFLLFLSLSWLSLPLRF